MTRFFLSMLLVHFAIPSSSFGAPKEVQALQEAVRKVVADTEPSVACILVSYSDRYREFNSTPSSEPGKLGGFEPRLSNDPVRRELIRRLDLSHSDAVPEAYGNGVVVEAGGLVLTHFHVIQNATKIFVRLPGKKGSYADIYAADSCSDLAVLKLLDPPAGLKPIRFGDGSKARKGDFVVGVAFPFVAGARDAGPIASHGIVSVQARETLVPAHLDRSRVLYQPESMLQIDLRLSIGCSGAAVVNLDGELIGLTTHAAVIGDRPGGFVLPMDAVMKRIVSVMKKGEEVEYGFLGVNFVPRGGGLGAMIDHVADGTPAKRARLFDRDVITAVNDMEIRNYDDLLYSIGGALAGSEVFIDVKRLGEAHRVSVKLSKFNLSGASIATNRRPPVFGLRVDYNSMANSDAQIPEGVFIRDVDRGSAADKKYKELFEYSRWIITSVNGKAISNPADFYAEVGKAKRPLELRIAEVGRPETNAKTITLP